MRDLKRRIASLALASLLTIGACGVFGASNVSAGTRLVKQNICSTESSANISNPDRGFYVTTSTPYISGQSNYMTDEEVSSFLDWAFVNANNYQSSLIYLSIKLNPTVGITAADSDNLAAILCTMESHGFKAIVRAAYDTDGSGTSEPADINTVLTHIEQLSDIFNSQKNAISVVQCGLLGLWGEMHTSSFMPILPDGSYDLTNVNLVIEKYTSCLDSDIQFSVRRPLFYRSAFGTNKPITSETAFNNSNSSRVGFYNDGFLCDPTDCGTYASNEVEFERTFQNSHNLYTIFGGEAIMDTPNENADGDYAIDYMQLTHVSYLNSGWNTNLHDLWRNSSCPINAPGSTINAYDYIASHMGYRFVLRNSYLPATVKAGRSVSVSLDIENTGFSNIVNDNEVDLIFVSSNGKKVYTVSTSVDPRTWNAGETTNESFTVTAPSRLTRGTWNVYLSIPDTTDCPSSAVQFANETGFDSTLNANYIGNVTVR